MLHPSDTITLAPGVRLEGALLVDEVRGERYPANATAHLVLSSDVPLGSVAERLATTYSLPREAVLDDVLGFAWGLNRALLVNVAAGQTPVRRLSTWIGIALRGLPTGTLPPPGARRRPLDTRSCRLAVASTLRALRVRIAVIALAVALLAAELGLLVAASPATLLQAAAIGLVAGLGLGLHEAAHAAALRGVEAGLVTVGPSTFVLHRRLGASRRVAVALAGPALPAAVGVGLATVATVSGSVEAAIVACPLGAHALTATVAGRDGRIACAG
jgi:hypothetical protein